MPARSLANTASSRALEDSEVRHLEAAGFAVGVWINAFGYGNHRPFFKDSMKITTLEGKAQGGGGARGRERLS